MICLITRPDSQTLFDQQADSFVANVLGGSSIVPESNEWYVVSLNYAMAEEFYAISEQQWKETDPSKACCENLVIIAARDGVFPKGAGFAEGYVRITGTPGTAIPAQLGMTIGSQDFVTIGTAPAIIPAEGYVIIRARANSPGIAGNVSAATGVLQTTIDGLDSEVTLQGGNACGGTAEETCDQFRARYLARLAFKPRADAAWISEKALEWPCATRICRREGNCCETLDEEGCESCRKKLEFYVFFDNTFECGIPPQCVVDDMNLWMFGSPQGYGTGQTPIGVCGAIRSFTGVIVDLVITNGDCYTVAQQNLIRTRIIDFFGTICPSQDVDIQSIHAIISQVTGKASASDLAFRPVDDAHMKIDACGSIVPDCDYIPCIGSIFFQGATTGNGCS